MEVGADLVEYGSAKEAKKNGEEEGGVATRE